VDSVSRDISLQLLHHRLTATPPGEWWKKSVPLSTTFQAQLDGIFWEWKVLKMRDAVIN